jgi:hypothetical protein
VTTETAEKVLNREAIRVYDAEDSHHPDRLYAVYRGVVYELVPTRPGVFYHGYPWRGDLPGRPGLPRWVLRALRECADRRAERRELEKWLKKYGGPGW